MLSSSGREEAMFTVAGLFPLKPVMLLMPCHMLLGLLLLKCSSTTVVQCLGSLCTFCAHFMYMCTFVYILCTFYFIYKIVSVSISAGRYTGSYRIPVFIFLTI